MESSTPSTKTGKYDWRDPRSDTTKAELIRGIIPQFGQTTMYYIDVAKAKPEAVSRYEWLPETNNDELYVTAVDTKNDVQFPSEAKIVQIACGPKPHRQHFLGFTIGGVHCPLVRVRTGEHDVNFHVEWDKAKFPHGIRVVMHGHHAHLRPDKGTGVVICTHIETQEEREERYTEALLGHPMVAEMLSDQYDRSSGFGDLRGNQQLVKVQWENSLATPDTVYAHWIGATFDPK